MPSNDDLIAFIPYSDRLGRGKSALKVVSALKG